MTVNVPSIISSPAKCAMWANALVTQQTGALPLTEGIGDEEYEYEGCPLPEDETGPG